MVKSPHGLHPYRYRITATLEARSHLHVGTGELESGILPERMGEDGETISPVLARVVRDDNGAFFLPGSTLKNLLRRAEPDAAKAGDLFGEIRDGDKGRMGAVFVWGASCTYLPLVRHAPGPGIEKLNGAFVAARTAIDRKRGTAAEHRLFFQEMVPAGSTFALDLLVVGDKQEMAESRARRVLTILRRLESGSFLGKGQADGHGRVGIQPGSITCIVKRIDPDTGDLRDDTATDLIPADSPVPAGPAIAAGPFALTLRCDGPFMIVDSFHKRQDDDEQERNRAHLKAQRLTENLPLILGNSIMGVLRARAAWLDALDRDDLTPRDGCFDSKKGCRTRADAEGLGPVERLFGVTGFRGLLSLETLTIKPDDKPTWNTLTSVKLDRFSGAPFDGGLFTSAVFVGVILTLTLALHDRSGVPTEDQVDIGVGNPTATDRRLLASLLRDVRNNGLMLGHGTNKGFGWFERVTA